MFWNGHRLFTGRRYPRTSWPALFVFGLISRISIVLFGCQVAVIERPAWLHIQDEELVASGNRNLNTRHLDALSLGRRRWIEPWYRWDAIWYAEISQRRYTYEAGRQSSVAFLPLLPLIMTAGAMVGLDRYTVGLLLPNLAFSVGLAFFGKAVWRVTANTETVWRSCILVVVYPWSFFYSAPYQESLGFAMTAAAILAWLHRRPLSSALSFSGATAAQLGAGALSLAVLLEWADDLYNRRPRRDSAWLVAMSGAFGFGVFSFFLYSRFGDPLLHLRAHAAWGRKSPSLTNVLASLVHVVVGFRPGETPADYFVMAIFLLLGIRAWRKRGPFWGCLVLVPVIQVLASGTVVSLARVVLAAFPAAVDAAELLANRASFSACTILCIIIQLLLIALYINWAYVG